MLFRAGRGLAYQAAFSERVKMETEHLVARHLLPLDLPIAES
jgi:hypothetical protein